jgi:hypothetical protein
MKYLGEDLLALTALGASENPWRALISVEITLALNCFDYSAKVA